MRVKEGTKDSIVNELSAVNVDPFVIWWRGLNLTQKENHAALVLLDCEMQGDYNTQEEYDKVLDKRIKLAVVSLTALVNALANW